MIRGVFLRSFSNNSSFAGKRRNRKRLETESHPAILDISFWRFPCVLLWGWPRVLIWIVLGPILSDFGFPFWTTVAPFLTPWGSFGAPGRCFGSKTLSKIVYRVPATCPDNRQTLPNRSFWSRRLPTSILAQTSPNAPPNYSKMIPKLDSQL